MIFNKGDKIIFFHITSNNSDMGTVIEDNKFICTIYWNTPGITTTYYKHGFYNDRKTIEKFRRFNDLSNLEILLYGF